MFQGVTGEVEYLVNVMWPLTRFKEAEAADSSGLDRQQLGATGLGSSQQRVTPPSDWKPPPKPGLMTSGRSRRSITREK
jgi:hypothetical protein